MVYIFSNMPRMPMAQIEIRINIFKSLPSHSCLTSLCGCWNQFKNIMNGPGTGRSISSKTVSLNVLATQSSHPLSRALICTDSYSNRQFYLKISSCIGSSFQTFFVDIITPRKSPHLSFWAASSYSFCSFCWSFLRVSSTNKTRAFPYNVFSLLRYCFFCFSISSIFIR